MERPRYVPSETLPGQSALQNAYADLDSLHEESYGQSDVIDFLDEDVHRNYLKNPYFHEYLKMDKIAVGSSGTEQLLQIGDELLREYLPTYLDAAGWAYAEAGLYDTDASTVERMQRIQAAEHTWTRAIQHEVILEKGEYGGWFQEETEPLRLATNLAFTPLMKSLVVGDVTEDVLSATLTDTLSIAELSTEMMHDAVARHDKLTVNLHTGLLHELNALLSLLYLNDPRYVPLPATARADSGYYHKDQTHDISLINQHWGTIKKVIPVEIKARATLRDRQRYKALVIRGKMHLTPDGVDPRQTVAAFAEVMSGKPTPQHQLEVDIIATRVRELLRLYQKGDRVEETAIASLTHFYESKLLTDKYPELSKTPRLNQKKN